MPGLVPGIHVFCAETEEGVDGRVKPGHDESARFVPMTRVGDEYPDLFPLSAG
jgi:hypothetical protein